MSLTTQSIDGEQEPNSKFIFFSFYFWSERDFKRLSIYISAVLSDCNLNFEYKLSNVENRKPLSRFTVPFVCLLLCLSGSFFFFIPLMMVTFKRIFAMVTVPWFSFGRSNHLCYLREVPSVFVLRMPMQKWLMRLRKVPESLFSCRRRSSDKGNNDAATVVARRLRQHWISFECWYNEIWTQHQHQIVKLHFLLLPSHFNAWILCNMQHVLAFYLTWSKIYLMVVDCSAIKINTSHYHRCIDVHVLRWNGQSHCDSVLSGFWQFCRTNLLMGHSTETSMLSDLLFNKRTV